MKILKSILLTLLVISSLFIVPNVAFAQETFFDSPTELTFESIDSNDFFSSSNSDIQIDPQASNKFPDNDFVNLCEDYGPTRIKVTNSNGSSVFATAEILSSARSQGLLVYGGGVHSPIFSSICSRGGSAQNFSTIRKDLGATRVTHLWTNVKNVLSGKGSGFIYCKDRTGDICQPYNGTWTWRKA